MEEGEALGVISNGTVGVITVLLAIGLFFAIRFFQRRK